MAPRIDPITAIVRDVGEELDRASRGVESTLRRARLVPPPPDPDRTPRTGQPVEARPDTVELTNPRFADEPTLARVRAGARTLGRGAAGEPVARVQTALADLGFPVASDAERDGRRFGPETRRAVERFQAEVGLEVDGVVGKTTLGVLDRLSPPPGAELRREPEYDRLFADGRLDVTLAVGFDEHDTGARADEVEANLRAAGYARLDPDALSPRRRAALGLSTGRGGDEFPIFHKRLWDPKTQRHADSLVKLITPEDGPRAREAFRAALGRDEVVLYTGHARYGTGPDFDAKSSGAGNFVIDPAGNHLGADRPPRELAKALSGRGSDLPSVAGAPAYQLLVLNACSTENYLEALRARFPGRDTTNTDVIATRIPTLVASGPDHVARALRGIEARESVNSLVEAGAELELEYLREVDKPGRDEAAKVTYVESGFVGNTGNRWVKRRVD